MLETRDAVSMDFTVQDGAEIPPSCVPDWEIQSDQ